MSSESFSSTMTSVGPTGFITAGDLMLVVDDGRIYKDGLEIGFLYEDGYLKDTSDILGNHTEQVLIDSMPGFHFRGIDQHGLEINLPGLSGGPTGNLIYNSLSFNVINGRVITNDHLFVAEITDEAQISLRDKEGEAGKIKLDESTLLNYTFHGKNSRGEKCEHQFSRPLYRPDKSYTDNEIIRYFDRFDSLSGMQKKYVLDTMSLWSKSGLLQVVRKRCGDAALGNVKHGVTGVTRIRTGNVTLDKEEFENEVTYYRQHGASMTVPKSSRDYFEVRLNLVLVHEFGHQIDFVLAQSVQEQIAELYARKSAGCKKTHPLPANYEGISELLMVHQLDQRHFISGYAATNAVEYWAECLAAFSVKETRALLKELDPTVYRILVDLVLRPRTVLSRVLHDTILALQASLKFGGEFNEEILA